MSSDDNKFSIPFEDSRRGRPENIEGKAIGRRIGSFLASRAIDRPSIGRRRGRRDIDIPTGGVPGSKKPTGSRLDPDKDGWADEGTTKPVWVGIDGDVPENVSVQASSGPTTRPIQNRSARRLSSGANKDLDRAKTRLNSLRRAQNEFKESRNWIGGDLGVVIGTPDAQTLIASGIDDDRISPKNRTRSDWEEIFRAKATAQGISEDSELRSYISNEFNKLDKSIDDKVVLAEQELRLQEYIAQKKTERADQNVIDVDSLTNDQLALLAEESEALMPAGGASPVVPQFSSESTDSSYFLHLGPDSLDGGLLDPSKSRGDESGTSVAGNTKLINSMVYGSAKSHYKEMAGLERGLRQLKSRLSANEDEFNVDSNDMALAMSRFFPPRGGRKKWGNGEKFSFAKYFGDSFDYDEISARIDSLIDEYQSRRFRSQKIVARLDATNGQYLSAYRDVAEAVDAISAGSGAYFARYADQDVPDDIKQSSKPMAARWASKVRGGAWLGHGVIDDEVSFYIPGSGTPSEEMQILSKNKPIIGFSVPASFSSIDERDKYAKAIPALLARAIRAHKDGGEVSAETLIGDIENRGPISPRFSSGATKPRYPRKPTYGAFIGGANEEFEDVRTWQDFKEKYDGREIVFLDYETTGLVFDEFGMASSNGQPVQIGAVKVKNGEIVDRINVFMNPEEPLSDWSRANLKDRDGSPLTDEWLSGQMSIADAHRQLVDFAGGDAIFGVQNAAFDKDVLELALSDSGIQWRPYGYIDTKDISDMTLPKYSEESPDGPFKIVDGIKKPSNGLADITKYLEVDLGEKHHTADADAEATALVMKAIMERAAESGWSADVLDPDLREAKRTANNDKFAKDIAKFESDLAEYKRLSSGEDYRGLHAAPNRDGGAPLNDMTVIYPEDVYSDIALRSYGTGYDDLDKKAFDLIRQMRGRPNAMVAIYRAMPKSKERRIAELEKQKASILKYGRLPRGVQTSLSRSEYYEKLSGEIEVLQNNLDDDIQERINPGDWVTPFREYAVEHGESALNNQYVIVTKRVKASELYTEGNSWLEWGYDPENKNTLSSGMVADRPVIQMRPIAEAGNDRASLHMSRDYKYGDTSELGGLITRERKDWLKGLSSKQISELVVPESYEQYVQMWVDEWSPGSFNIPKHKQALEQYLTSFFEKSRFAEPDFSPDSISATREIVRSALDQSPRLKWLFENYGSPIFYMQTENGAKEFMRLPRIQERLEELQRIRGLEDLPKIKASTNPGLGSVSLNPLVYMDESVDVPRALQTDAIPTSKDSHVDNSLTAVIAHEYGHWLHHQALRETEKAKPNTRSRYGSSLLDDEQYYSAISVAEKYKGISTNRQQIEMWKSGTSFDETPDTPRILTSYGNTNGNELIAEALVAIIHPNRDIQDSVLSERLKNDAYSLIGGVDIFPSDIDTRKSETPTTRLSSGVDISQQNNDMRIQTPTGDIFAFTTDNKASGPEVSGDEAMQIASVDAAFVPKFKGAYDVSSAAKRMVSQNIANSYEFDLGEFIVLFEGMSSQFGGGYGFADMPNFYAISNLVLNDDLSPEDKKFIITPDGQVVAFFEKEKLSGWAQILYRDEKIDPDDIYDATTASGIKALRSAVVSDFIATWATTSNNHTASSLAVQHAARRMFGLDQAAGWDTSVLNRGEMAVIPDTDKKVIGHKFDSAPKLGDKEYKLIQQILGAQYAATQEYFQSKGITHLQVFRGMNSALTPSSLNSKEKIDGMQTSFVDEAISRPLSSWSTSHRMATVFAGTFPENSEELLSMQAMSPRQSVVISTWVPIEYIFSTPFTGFGSMKEDEVVVIGNPLRSIFSATKEDAGKLNDIDFEQFMSITGATRDTLHGGRRVSVRKTWGGESMERLSSGRTYQQLVDSQPELSAEKIQKIDAIKNVLSGREFSIRDEYKTRIDEFGDEVSDYVETPSRNAAKTELINNIADLFNGEIITRNDVILKLNNGDEVNVGRKFKIEVDPTYLPIRTDIPDAEEIDEMRKTFGLGDGWAGNVMTEIPVHVSIIPVSPDATLSNMGEDGKSGEFQVTQDGRIKIGEATRRIFSTPSGMYVAHESFFIDHHARGNGIGSLFNARNENIYKGMGVEMIMTSAQSSTELDQTGASHWPRNGFTWAGEDSKQKFLDILDTAIKNNPTKLSNEEMARVTSLYSRLPQSAKFTTDATIEQLIDFDAVDEIFALGETQLLLRRDLGKPSVSSGGKESGEDRSRLANSLVLSSGRRDNIDDNGRFTASLREYDEEMDFLVGSARAFTDFSDEQIKQAVTAGIIYEHGSKARDFRRDGSFNDGNPYTSYRSYENPLRLADVKKYLSLENDGWKEPDSVDENKIIEMNRTRELGRHLRDLARIRTRQIAVESLASNFSDFDAAPPSMIALVATNAIMRELGWKIQRLVDTKRDEYFDRETKNLERMARAAEYFIDKFNKTNNNESLENLIMFFAEELNRLQRRRKNAEKTVGNTSILDGRMSFAGTMLEMLMETREQLEQLNHPELPFNTSRDHIDKALVATNISALFDGHSLFNTTSPLTLLQKYLISESFSPNIENSKPEPPPVQKGINRALKLFNKLGMSEDKNNWLLSVGNLRSITRAIYQATQDTLNKNGIRSIKLYRGSSNEKLRNAASSSPNGEIDTNIRLRPTSSWTFSPNVAHGFYGNYLSYSMNARKEVESSQEMAQRFANHVVYEAFVPAGQIFNFPEWDTLEHEVRVIGPSVKAKVVPGDYENRDTRLSSGAQSTLERKQVKAFTTKSKSRDREINSDSLWQLMLSDREEIPSVDNSSRYSDVSSDAKRMVTRNIAESINFSSQDFVDAFKNNDDENSTWYSSDQTWFNQLKNFETIQKISRSSNPEDKKFSVDQRGNIFQTNDADSHSFAYLPFTEEFDASTEEGEMALRAAIVSDVVHSWAISSNDNNSTSLAIQHVARKLFGIDSAVGWDSNPQNQVARLDIPSGPVYVWFDSSPSITESQERIIRDILRAQYDATQQYLKSKGITHLQLIRGMKIEPSQEQLRSAGLMGDYKSSFISEVLMRPLSSWTANINTAVQFAQPSGAENAPISQVASTWVPVEHVFSSPFTGFGCLFESEYVVLGAPLDAIVSTTEEDATKIAESMSFDEFLRLTQKTRDTLHRGARLGLPDDQN